MTLGLAVKSTVQEPLPHQACGVEARQTWGICAPSAMPRLPCAPSGISENVPACFHMALGLPSSADCCLPFTWFPVKGEFSEFPWHRNDDTCTPAGRWLEWGVLSSHNGWCRALLWLPHTVSQLFSSHRTASDGPATSPSTESVLCPAQINNRTVWGPCRSRMKGLAAP